MNRNQVTLTPEERAEFEKFGKAGVRSVRLVNRAKIILALDTYENSKVEKQDLHSRAYWS